MMKVSIIIPALNAADILEKAVARLRLTAGRGDIEIVVVDGKSNDETMAIARRVADRVIETSGESRADRMHAGALAATGELLLFLYPETRLAGRWLGSLLDAWSGKPRPGATAFQLAFDRDEPSYRALAAVGNAVCRWVRMPRGNQALACRRIDYLRAGGFPSVPHLEAHLLIIPELAVFGPIVFLDDIVTAPTDSLRRSPFYDEVREAAILILFKAGITTERLAKLYQWTS
jgi:glycosyltransferase involved in cell wall biosynthesis